MKKTIKLFGIIALVAVIGFLMVSCGDDEPGVEDGNLAGTSWRLAPGQGQAYVSIISFIDGSHSKIMREGQPNSTTNYTYIYSHELKMGTMENGTGGTWIKTVIFSISDDYRTLRWDNANLRYNRE